MYFDYNDFFPQPQMTYASSNTYIVIAAAIGVVLALIFSFTLFRKSNENKLKGKSRVLYNFMNLNKFLWCAYSKISEKYWNILVKVRYIPISRRTFSIIKLYFDFLKIFLFAFLFLRNASLLLKIWIHCYINELTSN